jgi:iron complex transport system substrate-binding protein
MEGVLVRGLMVFLAAALMLTAQPKRIVSTAPSITETLFALGLGDRVVAVSQHCHYPPEANTRPRVGSYLKPNIEVIVSLRPDLVIVQAKTNDAAEQLERVKVNVLQVEHGDLEKMFAGMRLIASRCGVPERGAKLEAEIRARLATIRQRTKGLPRRSLVFIVGRNPGSLNNLIAVGKGSYLNELIAIAGGVNALAETPMPYPKVSLESIFGLNPDVLIDMGDMAETLAVTEEHKRSVVALWSGHPALKAVAQKRVFAVAADIFVVPGPRVAEAAEAFEKMLHPEVSR